MPATGIISLSVAHTNGHNSIATLYHTNHQWYIFHHHHPVLIHHHHHHHARGHNSIATLDWFILFIFERVPGLGLQLKDFLPPPSIPTTLEYQIDMARRRAKLSFFYFGKLGKPGNPGKPVTHGCLWVSQWVIQSVIDSFRLNIAERPGQIGHSW